MNSGPGRRGHGASGQGLKRFLKLLPLYITYSIVISTWLGFLGLITIKEVLLRRHDTWRFLEQIILLNGLFGLTIVGLITASTCPPGSPDPSLAPAQAREKRQPTTDDWDDDIPLRTLRDARHRSALSDDSTSSAGHLGSSSATLAPDGAMSATPFIPDTSHFPLKANPFVPTSATAAGEEDDRKSGEGSGDLSVEVVEDSDREALIPHSGQWQHGRSTLFAKSSSGGIRWCKKCNGWKPDRCHHCRHCRRCTLKMDHHCVWLATCIGYHNYKSFLLFVTYGTLFALYILIEALICTVQYFSDPGTYSSPSANDMGASEIVPVTFMFLAILGGFFTLTIGGLAVYHWHLACLNKTTLEDITNEVPAVLLSAEDHADGPPREWRGDHLLSRPERVRLRSEASKLNVYDLGWRRNLASIFCPGHQVTPRILLACLWPAAIVSDRLDTSAGHYFDHDPVKLERLRELTLELRTSA